MPERRRHFSRRAIFAAAVAILSVRPSRAEDGVATAETPAILQIGAIPAVPPGGRRRLELTLLGFTPPVVGAVSAAVRLGDGSKRVEVGRFSLYPADPFEARSEEEARRFQFDLTTALPANGADSWNIEIRLEPLQAGQLMTGARMRFGTARITIS
jgi:hypothetical protein